MSEAQAEDHEAVGLAPGWLADSRALVRSLADQLDVEDPGALADQVWLIVEGVYAGGPTVADAAGTLTRRLLEDAAAATEPRSTLV